MSLLKTSYNSLHENFPLDRFTLSASQGGYLVIFVYWELHIGGNKSEVLVKNTLRLWAGIFERNSEKILERNLEKRMNSEREKIKLF